MPPTALKRSIFGLLAVLAATACGGGAPPARLAPMATDSASNAHQLRPGDIVKVQVFGHDELSGEFPIDENDTLLLPIVGGFSVEGMTVNDLRGRIRREFGQLYTQSFVAVTPLFRVAVLGEVVRPGLYSVDPTMTVYTVIAEAGGTLKTANEAKMRLIRNGMQVAIPLDAASLATATIRELGIRSGDQIIVPRKPVGYDTWLIGLQLLNVMLVAYSIFRK
jgi:polysaccharide export outer membrane protein